jgi:ubiquinone/menaquinone biosynthesis C-methylase UbiE
VHTAVTDQTHIIDCYDKTAQNYAEQFGDELAHKHLDRILLRAFASENLARGRLIDLGCGPGQTTRFLADCGLKDILGVDLSPQMVKVAGNLHPDLSFSTADMLRLPYPDQSFGSAIAFYSIVHFTDAQVSLAFKEIKRVLIPGGQLLFSFHVGTERVHLDHFLDHPVSIDFYFFEPEKIADLLTGLGFGLIDALERQPYPEVEYPSRRAYIWAQKQG